MTSRLFTTSLCAALLAGSTSTSQAVTAAELSRKLTAGEVVQLIDLRPKNRYETGTIPGAMSIPATIIIEKKLPPLSPVVVFDDGLGGVDVPAIVTALNQRPGWKAEMLEGGFAAWLAQSEAPQTSPVGLRNENIQHITYDDLVALKENVVLVDLRPVDPAAKGTNAKAEPGKKPMATSSADPVTEFCGKSKNRSYQHSLGDFRQRFQPSRRPKEKAGRPGPNPNAAEPTPPLVVLVDAVGADTRETVRRLRAEGYARVLILAGGDEAILLQGRRGKGRISGTLGQGTVADPAPPSNPAKP